MGYLHKSYFFCSVFLCIAFLCIIAWNITTRQAATLNWETYTSLVHAQILKLIHANRTTDAKIAWKEISEAISGIDLLCRLTGGEQNLSSICGTNIAHIKNTAKMQEIAVLRNLTFGHPLEHAIVIQSEENQTKNEVVDS